MDPNPVRKSSARKSRKDRRREAAIVAAEKAAAAERKAADKAADTPLATQEKDDDVHQCAVCLDAVPKDALQELPCSCKIQYCKQCWSNTMVKHEPKCPSCRASISVDYSTEKGECIYGLLSDVEEGKFLYLGSNAVWDRHDTDIETRQLDRRRRFELANEMYRRTKPTLLRNLSVEKNTDFRDCVCGGKDCLRRLTWEERMQWSDLTEGQRAGFCCGCDACGEDQYTITERYPPSSAYPKGKAKVRAFRHPDTNEEITHIWSCDRNSAAHYFGYTICDKCVKDPKRFDDKEPPVLEMFMNSERQ